MIFDPIHSGYLTGIAEPYHLPEQRGGPAFRPKFRMHEFGYFANDEVMDYVDISVRSKRRDGKKRRENLPRDYSI